MTVEAIRCRECGFTRETFHGWAFTAEPRCSGETSGPNAILHDWELLEAAKVYGFTGTSKGMTAAQAETFAKLLALRGERAGDKFLHGLCVGADEQAHRIADELGMKTIGAPGRLVGDPARSVVRCHVTLPVPKSRSPELERNRRIARNSSLLFAAPRNQEGETRRSGTWATVRYARQHGTPVIVIRPDGSVDLSEEAPRSGAPSDRPPAGQQPKERTVNDSATLEDIAGAAPAAEVNPDPKPSSKGRGRRAAPAAPAAPAATEAPSMQPLYNELLKAAKAAVKGAEIVEKKVYVRLSLNKKAVAYINHPGKKNVRVEIPKKTGGGYDVIAVTDSKGVEKVVKAIGERVALVTA